MNRVIEQYFDMLLFYEETLKPLLQEKGITKINITGHSLGGYLAQRALIYCDSLYKDKLKFSPSEVYTFNASLEFDECCLMLAIIFFIVIPLVLFFYFKYNIGVFWFVAFFLAIFYYTPYSFYLEPSYWQFKNMCKLNELPNNEEKYNKILGYFDLSLDTLDWEKLNEKTWKIKENSSDYKKKVYLNMQPYHKIRK